MYTGIYVRVQRDGKWDSILLEDCTEEERAKVLQDWPAASLLATIEVLIREHKE